jgi:hypothetical protein
VYLVIVEGCIVGLLPYLLDRRSTHNRNRRCILRSRVLERATVSPVLSRRFPGYDLRSPERVLRLIIMTSDLYQQSFICLIGKLQTDANLLLQPGKNGCIIICIVRFVNIA